ncbi:MAG: class I SAM-dependent rRNA methyltransferase, partial [Anaerolineales bacterium]
TAGAEAWRDRLVELIASEDGIQGVYERSDVDVREREGLETRTGILAGEGPPDLVEIQEYGLRFGADLRAGQKTGFYLDQRENRRLLPSLVHGADVLDCFAYTGGFSVAALSGGAGHVLAVESSGQALAIAKENLARNGHAQDHWEGRQADVFEELRRLRDRGQSFDVVILDPPRFAPTSAQVDRAARGYKDINLLAFKLLRTGGLLVTFSCSGGVEPALFQKIVAAAALDAGVEARIQNWLGQPADHPVAMAFPEGRYLKGLVCRVG